MAEAHFDRVAVVGAGVMGRRIALACATGGARVGVVEVDADALTDALEDLAALAGRLSDYGLLREPPARVLDRLHGTTDLAAGVDGTALVIEAVPERLAVKLPLFERLDALCPPTTVLTSNTSGFRIAELAAPCGHPERVLGTHWINPPHLMPPVEVTPGPLTAPAVVDAVCAFVTSVGKVPVRLRRDTPGFIANRVQFAGLNEAIRLVEDDVADGANVDLAVRLSFLLRQVLFGPLAAHDYFGRKYSSHGIFTYLAEATDNPQFRPGALFEAKVEAEATGAVHSWYEPGTLPEIDAARRERLLVDLLLFLRERGLAP